MRSIHHRAWFLSLLSASLQILIFPLPALYPLCWFAVTPLLVALVRARASESLQLELEGPQLLPARTWQGFLLGYVCGIFFYAFTCSWIFNTMRQYGGLSFPMSAFMLLLFCGTAGLGHGLFAACFARLATSRDPTSYGATRFALLIAPVLWVGVELARTYFLDFPWNLLGTVQVDNIPLARIATVTGVYGISFEIVLVNAALATAILLPRERRTLVVAITLGIAALLQAGRWLPQGASPSDRVAILVQENVPVLEGSAWTTDYFQARIREFRDLSITVGKHPELVVWPESPSPFVTRDPLFLQPVSALAQQTQSWMIIGSTGVDDPLSPHAKRDAYYNSAALFSPAGDLVARYDKIHLVPFGEYVPFRSLLSFADSLTRQIGTFERGTSRQPLHAGKAWVGAFICYEDAFPDEVRQFANNGAQVFVNVSNDGWYGDSGAWAQHIQQARMRAIENNRWLLRDTNTGLTAAIDPQGRVVASVPRKERTRLEAPYALIDGTTFYTRHGGWFAYLCAIISLVALIDTVLVRTLKS